MTRVTPGQRGQTPTRPQGQVRGQRAGPGAPGTGAPEGAGVRIQSEAGMDLGLLYLLSETQAQADFVSPAEPALCQKGWGLQAPHPPTQHSSSAQPSGHLGSSQGHPPDLSHQAGPFPPRSRQPVLIVYCCVKKKNPPDAPESAVWETVWNPPGPECPGQHDFLTPQAAHGLLSA